ncbi:MAG: methionine/alanine import family NSS transporter small subunit [Nocardioides sp.]
MGTGAILMMLLAMLVIWGGLALAIVNLSRSADTPTTDEVRRDL